VNDKHLKDHFQDLKGEPKFEESETLKFLIDMINNNIFT